MAAPYPKGADPATDWRKAVLHDLGAPIIDATVKLLGYWARQEGAPASKHNWLNTSLGKYGAKSVDSSGIPAYPNAQAGVNATVFTLHHTAGAGYEAIVSALRDAKPVATWRAINQSKWCGSGCGPNYPGVVHDHLAELVKLAKSGEATGPGTTGTTGPAVQKVASKHPKAVAGFAHHFFGRGFDPSQEKDWTWHRTIAATAGSHRELAHHTASARYALRGALATRPPLR